MAGTVTWTLVEGKLQNRDRSKKYVVTWVADASDGSVPSVETTSDIFGFVTLVVTDPGATAPTASYGITITDEYDCDILGGEGAARSATVSEQVLPSIGNSYGSRYVNGKLTFNLTGNIVNSATGEVVIYVEV